MTLSICLDMSPNHYRGQLHLFPPASPPSIRPLDLASVWEPPTRSPPWCTPPQVGGHPQATCRGATTWPGARRPCHTPRVSSPCLTPSPGRSPDTPRSSTPNLRPDLPPQSPHQTISHCPCSKVSEITNCFFYFRCLLLFCNL